MPDISKMVSDRADISHTVLSSLTVHGPEVVADLEKLLFPDGPPRHLTLAQVLTAIGGALSTSVTELTEADLANARELSDDDAPRTARDAGITVVRDRLINVRGLLYSVYGQSVLKAYGLSGETPEDPQQLVHRASNVASLLQTRALTEKPKQEDVTVDIKALGKRLADATQALDSALGDVRREEREAQMTRTRRDEAMITWNARYQGVADIATGLFELLGRGDLAERVRPTVRRRAGLTEEGDGTTANGTAAAPTPAGAPLGGLKLTPTGPDAVIAAPKPETK